MKMMSLLSKKALIVVVTVILLGLSGMTDVYSQSQGAINGLFSISENQCAYFSNGNLQYQASTNTWRFAEHQWDYVGGTSQGVQYGTVSGSSNNNISSTYSGWIDLFGWGTSGWASGATCYQPWSTSNEWSDYSPGGIFSTSMVGDYANADWGVYNAISNGGNQPGLWRTLTRNEWIYVFSKRNTLSGIRWARAVVNGVKGLIMFPNQWSASIYPINAPNDYASHFDSNIIDANTWNSCLEANGAVFFPACGFRDQHNYYHSVYLVDDYGCYHSSTPWGNGAGQFVIAGPPVGGMLGPDISQDRSEGDAVRLIQCAPVLSYTVSAASNIPEAGAVTGAAEFSLGSICTLSASANTGYTFVRWMKNGTEVSTEPTYSFMVTESASYVAEFVLNSYAITVAATPSQGGSVSGAGTYNHGATVTLTAQAHSGFIFVRWTKDGFYFSENPTCSFTVTEAGAYVAEFSGPGSSGQLHGAFSVSTNAKVRFSQGNLQYQPAGNTWRFAASQYAYVGEGNANLSPSYEGWIDLFGWGTSGYNHGAVCYQPWSASETNSDYYAYGDKNYHLFDQSGLADWGCNAILNGGNSANSGWRTLTFEEWDYLINTRSTVSGIRFAKARVDGVNGVILLPDNWSASFYSLKNTNNGGAAFYWNTITAETWADVFEFTGAVFLPAAGSRLGTTVNYLGSYGNYWTATSYDKDLARSFGFDGSEAYTSSLSTTYVSYRCLGKSVRLVRPTQNVICSVIAKPNFAETGTTSGTGNYAYGTTCTLTATANEGCSFMRWMKDGAQVSTDPVLSFTVTESALYVAEFGYNITTTVSPLNVGEVTGSGTYPVGQQCTLTASAFSGYSFVNWTENGEVVSGDATYVFQVTSSRSLVANFVNEIGHGKLDGVFSVSDNTQISFSKGNLQYQASTNTWRFATNQWDCLAGNNAQISETYSGWIDLFGWGTSGYEHGAVCYQPWSTNTSNANYNVYGNLAYNLFDQTGLADWGRNVILNGSNTEHSGWRTLSHEEWNYLVHSRNTPSGILFAKAQVNGVNGTILLPDDWNASYYPLNSTNAGSAGFDSNILDAGQWTVLEQHGAVFLPAAGRRSGTSVSNVGANGNYWSSSYRNNYNAWSMTFSGSSCSGNDNSSRCYGMSVRLVRPPQDYPLSVTIAPVSGGSVSGAGVYTYGSVVTVTATPGASSTFGIWTENGVPVSNKSSYTFVLTESRNLVAHFAGTQGPGLLNGGFSVSEDVKVQFSQGNLQYQASTNTWRFAQQQYDFVGQDNSNIASSNAGWIDLFGWGTSGFNHNNGCYQPWSSNTNFESYYAYGEYGYHLYDQTGAADWGCNAISNGGNQLGQWRTLTSEEWYYLLFTRGLSSDYPYYLKAKIGSVNGMIVLPDDWAFANYSLNYYGSNFDANILTVTQWSNLEQHGAVFLPAAGFRIGTSVDDLNVNLSYWTSSFRVYMYADEGWAAPLNNPPYYGYSVRLVRSFKTPSYEISAVASPQDGGTVTGGGTYKQGMTCTLVATPNTGYSFVHWMKEGQMLTTETTYSFTVTESASYVAIFEEIPVCDTPIDVAVTSNVGQTASLSWTSDASVWNLLLNGELIQGVSNPCILTDLDLGTHYEVMVQACCGENFFSEWSEAVSFTTDPCLPDDQCVINYMFQDGYGDGWNDNAIQVVDIGTNTILATLTLNSGSSASGSLQVCNGLEIQFVWVKGYFPDETSWNFFDSNGMLIWSGTGSSSMNTGDVIGNVTVACGNQSEEVEQSVELSEGWTWLSSYVQFDENTLQHLKDAIAAECSSAVIKSQSGGFAVYDGEGWAGALSTLDNGEMYLIMVDHDLSFEITGDLYDAASHPVTLKLGWNWFSYPMNSETSLSQALVGLQPTDGDVIKCQSSFSSYEALEGIWQGNLQTMEPGQGYIYLSNSQEDVSFIFCSEENGNVEVPEGAAQGQFSINAGGGKVFFSQGNLQYKASSNTWRFAEHQWDVVGNDNENVFETYDGWIDLFCWGTSGYAHGATCYQPWSTDDNNRNYFAYGMSNNNLYDGTGQADWGYNAISNGGGQENSGWRTLTQEEWTYLLQSRITTSYIRFAMANVNGVNGVILLPDDWNASYYTLNDVNNSSASYATNVITASQWSVLEQHGAVFLPCTGIRVETYVLDPSAYGFYWSSSYYNTSKVYMLEFENGNLHGLDAVYRSYAASVRLVRQVQ